MARKKEQPVVEETTLLKKYYDQVGRIVTGLRHKISRLYEIRVQLFDKNGNSMLTDSNGLTVSMLCYTFKDREAYKEALKRYPREKREELLK